MYDSLIVVDNVANVARYELLCVQKVAISGIYLSFELKYLTFGLMVGGAK